MGIRNKIKQTLHRFPLLFTGVNYLSDGAAYLRCLWHGSFSQPGEDVFVLNYFKGRTGTYLDVGTNHPFKLNNTYLLYRNGWTGLTLEPIPYLSKLHQQFIKQDIHLNVAVGESSKNLTFFELIPDMFSTFAKARVQLLMEAGVLLKTCHEVRIANITDIYTQFF